MKQKIGRVPGKDGLYPNVFSAVINRQLAKSRKKGEAPNPCKYFEYAKSVEQRYNRIFQM